MSIFCGNVLHMSPIYIALYAVYVQRNYDVIMMSLLYIMIANLLLLTAILSYELIFSEI